MARKNQAKSLMPIGEHRGGNRGSKENNTRIVNLAEDLRLYPSDIYSKEENKNLPPMQLMATDGSYIVTPRDCSDILTSESNIRDTGNGAGRIVSPGFNRDSPPPNGIRITCDRPKAGMNAFTWEHVTQLIGLHFSKLIHSPLVVIFNCTDAIARINPIKH
jgi:hypothetical protein